MNIKVYTDKNKIEMKGYIKTVRFNLTPDSPGGEEVSLEVDYFKNEDGDIFHNISFENHCYGSHESKISYYSLGLDALAEAIGEAQKISMLAKLDAIPLESGGFMLDPPVNQSKSKSKKK